MNSEVVSRNGIDWLRSGARLGRCVAALGALALSATAIPGSPIPMAQAGSLEPQKYVKSGGTGARLYNLPDPKGHVVHEVEPGTPLAVYGEAGGGRYLKVAAPGGVKIWVYGKYVVESQREGWLEIDGSYITMRPRPSSQNSYPLGQLDRGDRLLFIQRADPSVPMAEDWVQMYSPPDTKAYVLAAETASFPEGVDPKQHWTAAAAAALAARESGATPLPVEATGSKPAAEVAEAPPKAPQNVFEALRAADERWAVAQASEEPDYAAVLVAYEALFTFEPDTPTRNLINQRIELVKRHQDLAAIRADIAAAEEEKQRKLEEAQEQIRQMKRGSDPLWGRFQTRGWLERHKQKGEVLWLVRWGSEHVARLECRSGRYDLGVFEGFEVGVRGVPVRAASGDGSGYPVIDIDRLEVISARYSGKRG